MLDVTGDKPTPCHEIFWTVEDDGEVIEIEMISQVATEQNCAQVIEPFTIAVPLGSWTREPGDPAQRRGRRLVRDLSRKR